MANKKNEVFSFLELMVDLSLAHWNDILVISGNIKAEVKRVMSDV